MRTPSINVDEDIYVKFLDKIELDEITITQFINQAILDYVNETPSNSIDLSTANKIVTHPSDYLITELALRMIEKILLPYQRNSPDQVSAYNVINEMCLELLPLLDTPQSKLLQQEFNQDDALMIITKRIYKYPN